MFRPPLWWILWSETLPAFDRRFSVGAEREAFHIFAVCIVTLTGRFCNGFLSKQALKFYSAINKDRTAGRGDSLFFSEAEAICADGVCINSFLLDKRPMP